MSKKPVVDLRQKKRGRPSKAITDERNKYVAELLLKGWSRIDITNHCVDEWGLAETTMKRQIQRANEYIIKHYAENPAAVVNKHIAMYYDLYKEHKTIDPSSAIKALNSVEKLLKLHNPETLVQQNTLNVNLENLSFNELKKLLHDAENNEQ